LESLSSLARLKPTSLSLVLFVRRKVATFANSNSYGSSGISQFQSSAGALGIQIISSSLFPEGQTDFRKPIELALKSGARIFVFFMAGADMGNLLQQGHAAGLFGEGTQIIASDASASSIVWKNKITNDYLIPHDQVAKMMKGVIAFTPSADYNTTKGSKFLDSFIHQPNTVKDPLTGRCNNMTDDDGNYLFMTPIPGKYATYNCSGVDFSHFSKDGSNVDNYASYAYDATYAIARAMRVVLIDLNRPNITSFPDDLYRALINNVSFMGATGAVNFSRAVLKDSTRLYEGDRSTDAIYKIQNFSPDAFKIDTTGGSGFVTIGGWTVKGGNKFTAKPIYNTADGSVPTDLPPVIVLTMLPLFATILRCLGIVLLVTAVIIGMTLRCYRKTKLVRSIQYRMQCIMIFGAICGAARVFFGTTKVTDVNCSASMWLSHLAFWMMFAPMMLKTWRVHRIITNRTHLKFTLREVYVLRLFGAILLFVVAYLTVLQSLSVTTPKMVTVRSQIGIQLYLDDQCSGLGRGVSF
jgi:Receptor family ligand binding region/7 transmembrane sweet-taste receptor of 3 GCPR